jgi:hypothetical protein
VHRPAEDFDAQAGCWSILLGAESIPAAEHIAEKGAEVNRTSEEMAVGGFRNCVPEACSVSKHAARHEKRNHRNAVVS